MEVRDDADRASGWPSGPFYQEAETGQSYGVPELTGQRAGGEQRTLEA